MFVGKVDLSARRKGLKNETLEKNTISFKDAALIYFQTVAIGLFVKALISFAGALEIGGVRLASLEAFSLVGTLILQLAYLAIVVINLRFFKKELVYPIARVKGDSALFSALFAVVSVYGFVMLANWFELFLQSIGYTGSSVPETGIVATIVTAIVTTLIAPVAEELLFRGVLLGGLVKRFGVAASIFLSGLAFMLFHCNPQQTVYQFIIGCECAALAVYSRSILPSILLHAANNLIANISSYIWLPGIEIMGADTFWVGILVTVIGLAAGVALLVLLCKRLKKRETEASCGIFGNRADGDALLTLSALREEGEDDRNGESGSAVFGKHTDIIIFLLGMTICAVMWIAVFVQNILVA